MKKDTFTLRKTFLKPIANLDDAQLGRLFKAIYQYQCGEIPELTDDIAVYYSFFEAEFKAEEEKRRIRAEKAAERRRKKLEEAAAATDKKSEIAKQPEKPNTERQSSNDRPQVSAKSPSRDSEPDWPRRRFGGIELRL